MAVTKLSISVEEDLARVVRAAADDDGVSVSAWLTDAASDRIRNRLLGEAITAALEECPDLDEGALQDIAQQARAHAIVTSPANQ